MAADFITIERTDSNAIFAHLLQQAGPLVRQLENLLSEIQEKGYRMFESGPPADFTVFEQKFGIPEGQGQTVFDLVNGTLMALQGTAQNANAQELKNRVG